MRGKARWSYVTIGLAVIAAIAIAAPAIGGPSLKKLVKKEVAKQIAKATGPQGPPGANGTNGINGANGADGTARAYARVRSHALADCTTGNGCTFDHSKGVASVTRLEAGIYCVTVPGISPNSTAAAVTIDALGTGGPQANASAWIDLTTSSCDPDEFEVETGRQPSTTVCTNATCSTTAQVAGDGGAANNVSFTIVIP